MKKSVLMAAILVAFAACQKNKENQPATDENVTEVEVDSLTRAEDSVNNKEEDAVKVTETNENKEEAKLTGSIKSDYASFGDKIVADKVISKEEMLKKYKALKPGDIVVVKFKSKIKDVCQKKGCWMAMELPNKKESFVKFKDYAFFVPLNAGDHEAIVSGKAFVSETSVAQLRHYAKDGGKSEEEIAKITQPETEYKFLAEGVLISK